MSKKYAEWNRWNVYRYPDGRSRSQGATEKDWIWVGATVEQREAVAMLEEHKGGVIQFDKDGDVFDVDDQGDLTPAGAS